MLAASRVSRCSIGRLQLRSTAKPSIRPFSSSYTLPQKKQLDVEALRSKPSWSVASLLPSETTSSSSPTISSSQLHHLLRLSALPPPTSPAEETAMLQTLSSQLHFVQQIQSVDTTNVEPLRSLRDETEEGEKEAEVGLEALKGALEKEEVRGKFHQRIRRKREVQDGERWDVLGHAEKKVGRYFVVEGGKDR